MKWHELGVARSCYGARGGRATFLPGTGENSKRCGLCLGMCLDLFFGERGGEYQAKEKLALIPKSMYASKGPS